MAYSNIDKPTDYFNTLLWSGTGASNSLTGVGFQPDWTWIKKRSNTADYRIFDSVRGATKALKSNATQAEGTETQALTSFDSDGFTLGTDDFTNGSGSTFVGWNWLGGGTASSNTDGTITSSVSANTTSGFSVVTYTGTGSNATVGHGLGSEPDAIIFKSRSNAYAWVNYYKLLGTNSVLALNSTSGLDTGIGSSYFNSTSPTSSVFSLGTAANMNGSGLTFVAYCFKNIKGYSKIGKYRGNSSSDGVFVYLGFKPAMVMVKSNATEAWEILDNKRSNSFNAVDGVLFPNLSNAEETTNDICDFLSNGIKFRHSDGRHNSSAHDTYFIAFAESPLVGSNFVPTNAR